MTSRERKKKKDSRARRWWRVVKFSALQRVVLPLLMPVIWLYVQSWRMTIEPDDQAYEPFAEGKPGAVAVLHGQMLGLIGVMTRRWYGRKVAISVITSPSRDGRLQAALLHWFGQKTVVGSSKRGGAAGLLGLRSAIRDGRLGVIAVDGPRGPYGVAKQGVLTLAEGGRHPLWIVMTHASPALRLGSWDRQMVPAPFARIKCRVCRVPLEQGEPAEAQLVRLQTTIIEEMKQLGYEGNELPRPDLTKEPT